MVLGVLSGLAIILLGKRELPRVYLNCDMAFSVLCLFLMVPSSGLQCETGAFPGNSHL